MYTLTFAPEHALPNKDPTVLDPFLEPLVTELEELFIEGNLLSLLLFLVILGFSEVQSPTPSNKVPLFII